MSDTRSRTRARSGWGSQLIAVSDIMAGLLFIFILIVMVFVLRFRQIEDERIKLDLIRAEMLEEIREELVNRGVQVTVNTEQGVLRLKEDLLFESGEFELRDAAQRTVTVLASVLAEFLPQYISLLDAVFIEGHTDSNPVRPGQRDRRGRPIYDNWDLSALRAISTFAALRVSQPDLAELMSRDDLPLFSVSGYADQRPVRGGADLSKDEMSVNRRIDIRFIMVSPKPDAVRQLDAHLAGSSL